METSPSAPSNLSPHQRKTLYLDVETYLRQIKEEEWDISDEQAREFIDAMWGSLVEIAQLGFDIHPVQIACGQLSESPADATPEAPAMVEYEDKGLAADFIEVASERRGKGAT